MKFNALKPDIQILPAGRVFVTLEVDKQSAWMMRKHPDEMSAELVTVEIKKYRSQRSLDQNRFMWALLTMLADAMNAGMKRGVTAEDCYIDLLIESGVSYTYLFIPSRDERIIEKACSGFRATKICGAYTLSDSGKPLQGTRVQCFFGSSKFDTKEESQFIDSILDKLAEVGVTVDDAGEYQYLLNERRQGK
jgi:hypothetical protein